MRAGFLCMGIVSVWWVVIGYSLAFGDTVGGFIGNPKTFYMLTHVSGAANNELCPTIPQALFSIFQMKFAVITPALIIGA